jgi:hypothetical protein
MFEDKVLKTRNNNVLREMVLKAFEDSNEAFDPIQFREVRAWKE